MKKVAITGGAGQIAYSLLFRIASGEMFGKGEAISLRLLEVPQALDALKGVVMELIDCAFPLLQEIQIGSDPHQLFQEADLVLLLGAKPRGPGMERADLLRENAKIFVEQGKALNEVASEKTTVLVVGNPCNTNALIVYEQAPRLKNIYAMTLLDENRAKAQLARKAGCSVEEVEGVIIWGNHSATQVPDFTHAKIRGQPVQEVICDRKWLETTFFEAVQKRGAEVIAARGKSSSASAAHAILSTVQYLMTKGRRFSLCIDSTGNPYGIDGGLIYSFPCQSLGDGRVEIVSQLLIDPWIREKMELTQKELQEERTFLSNGK